MHIEPENNTAADEQTLDERLQNIMAHMSAQLRIQHKTGNFQQNNPVILSAADSITLLGYLSRLGLRADRGDPQSIAHRATILLCGNN